MKLNTPTTYNIDQLIENAGRVKCGLPDGRWVEARSESWQGICLIKRLRAAWSVFTGKADVLTWTDQ